MKTIIKLLSILWLGTLTLHAQKPYRSNWTVDGAVNVTATDNNYVYIGGQFSNVSINTGGGAKLSTTSDLSSSCFPYISGNIYAVTADGSGGWYIGGDFTAVGNVSRNRIAHILSTGAVDASWNPNANNIVYAIAVNGSYVYAGGAFTSIGGQTRNNIARLSNSNGNADSWNPSPDNLVRAIAFSGTDVYIGGSFSNVGITPRNRLAKIDVNGNVDGSWDPDAGASNINAIAVSGSNIYVGGDFLTLKGVTNYKLARLNDTNGNADGTWNPSLSVGDLVTTISVGSSFVYVGGFFSSIGGQTRNRIAKLKVSDGTADAAWNPNANGTPRSVYFDGTNIYVGGNFTSIGGQAINNVAKLDDVSGSADASWKPYPDNATLNAIVYAIAANGTDVFVGGTFTTINKVARNRIARFSKSTGTLDYNWNPNASGFAVYTINFNGSNVYVGGDFSSIGGQARSNIASLSNTTGLADSWNPNAGDVVSNITVSGSDIFVGGRFTIIAGSTRNSVAKFNIADGSLDATWNPNVTGTAFPEVSSIVVDGSNIYLGGRFTTVGATTRNYIARVNNTDGSADSWNPNANLIVSSIVVDGTNVYAAGSFTSIGGQTRNRLARLDVTTGLADSWDPNANNDVYGLILNGADIYINGRFSSIGGSTRFILARVKASDGSLDANWAPITSINIQASSTVISGNDIYAVGIFVASTPVALKNFAKFPLSSATTWTGSSSASWADACNWEPDWIPGSTDNVVIPSGTINTPDLQGYNFSVKDLTINTGATLQVNSGSLTVNGALSNNGTISSSNGTLVLAGTSAQQLDGSVNMYNLTVNNSSGVSIASGQTNITGTLAITSGTLATGGRLTLKSDVNGTARVSQLSGTPITGNVNVERYVSSKSERKWSFLSCPVSGNTIRNGWQDDIFITGAGTGGTICGTGGAQYNSNGFDVTLTLAPSMYIYNTTPVNGTRWVSVANTTSTGLTPGTGYRMNIRGARGINDANCVSQLTTTNPPSPSATTLSATGTLLQGTVNVPVKGKTSYNSLGGSGNAYSLIGNPYASEVSLQSVYADNTSIVTPSFWFYTPLNAFNVYSTYNALTGQALDFPAGYTNGSVSDVIINSGQAFMVERTGNADADIAFSETHKSTTVRNGNVFSKTAITITDKIKVQYTSTTDTTLKTSVYINYLNDPQASSTDVTPFDSYSFNLGSSFYLASLKGTAVLSIQTRAAFNGNDSVSLTLKGDPGTYKFNFSEFNLFTTASEIKLIDAYLNTVTDIRQNPEYSFSITGNAVTYGPDRFKIVFRSAPLPVAGIELSVKQKEEGVQLDWYVLSEYNISKYSVERSPDAKNFSAIAQVNATGNNNATVNYSWLDAKPFAATSYYRIRANGKSGDLYYSKIVKLQKDNATILHLYPNPVNDQLNILLSNSNNICSLRIMNAYGQQVIRLNDISSSAGALNINTTRLSPGVYTVQVIGTGGEVITERFVKQ